jgi:phytoene dehydrogenase-like protein
MAKRSGLEASDVVVVGAGLGGLTLGALLSKRGWKVTVLEQHWVPGGCATTFLRKEYRFEVSLHALDGLDDSDPKLPLFRELDLLDKLPIIRVPRSQFYRFKHPALDITIPASIEGAIQILGDAFPRERRRIAEFFHTVSGIRRELSRLFLADGWQRVGSMAALPFRNPSLLRYWNTTVGDFLDACFDSGLLKLALVANILYYHDDPRRLSLFWYCLSQGSFVSGGVHFIRGGSQILSNYLADYIRGHGGVVLLGQNVEEVLVERGKVVGVRFRKARGRLLPESTMQARVVVVNAALPTAVNDLITAPEIEPLRTKVNGLTKSCSFLSLFLGLKVPPKALGNLAYSTIIAGEDVASMDDLVAEFQSPVWSRKGFEFIDYSQIDHGLAPPGKSVGVISLVDYNSHWDGLSERCYAAQRAEVTQVLMEKLDRLVPGIRASVDRCEVGTPSTIVKYTRNPDGCIYGFEQTTGQAVPFRLGPSSPIQNLYFASAWVMPGGGYSGAMLAGMNCAREVDRALGPSRWPVKRWLRRGA